MIFHIVDCFSVSSLSVWVWSGILVCQKTDLNLSEPHTSHRILLLHFAHCTPENTGTLHRIWQDNGCLVVWFAVHESVVHVVVNCFSISSISVWNWILFCRNPILTLVHHPLHTAHCHCILHAAPKSKQVQCTADARVKCLVVWPTVHGVDRLRRWLLITLIDQ